MKPTRKSLPFVLLVLLFVPILRAQDLSKYRGISLGAKLPAVLKQTDQHAADVKVIHQKPAMLQELTWWPPLPLGSSAYRTDSVREILFAFDNGELYKMTVSYERNAVEGLTAEDMVASISAKYGAPAKISTEAAAATNSQQDAEPKVVARWEDPQYSLDLVRSSSTDAFGLVICAKRLNADAELAATEAAKLEREQRPQTEADRLKKETDELEATRQKNLKLFHP